VLHVADERLVRLIAIGKKGRHTFPANYRVDTREVCHPKITVGTVHKVYTRAPFGSKGDPEADPLLEVIPTNIRLDVLGDLDDGDARGEGFASIDAFAKWWNKVYYDKAKTFRSDPHCPVWVIEFDLKSVLPAGQRVIDRLERQSSRKKTRNRRKKRRE
jgi:hypothetical protein